MIWLALVAWAWFAAPVGGLPRSANSWDVLHSGRHFAERGFLESKLQPRWSPPNHPAPYLTYTHYPPLPYWVGGVVENLVRDPLARIDAMLRLVASVGISAVLCGYLFLRNVGIGVATAALASGALLWSAGWWVFATGELVWVSWLQLFQLGFVAALAWAFARWDEQRRRLGLLLALACAAAAALSAFDAWPWFPTLVAVLALLAARRRRDLLLPLVLATAVTASVSLAGAATRIALNWWHFGSLERVVQDLQETYAVRSTNRVGGLEIGENRANYGMEAFSEPAASHWTWVGEFWRTLLSRLAPMFLPDARLGMFAWGLVVVVALLARLLRGRKARDGIPEAWPGRGAWLVALSLAPVPFVLICPAMAVTQYCALLSFAPAVLLAGAWLCESAVAALSALAPGWLAGARLRRALTVALVCAVAISPVVRTPDPSPTWPAPPSEIQAAVLALSTLEGVVFVDLDDVNLLMFLAPLDSPVALKPIWSQAYHDRNLRPLRLLRIAGQGRLEGSEALNGWIDVGGVPEGFELLAAPRAP